MSKSISFLFGAGLIAFGLLSLGTNLLMSTFHINAGIWAIVKLWPLTVISVGLMLSLIPILFMKQRWAGFFFIPGIPVLVTGGILMFANMFGAWGTWAYVWPVEVMGVALGFFLAAIFSRAAWLIIPGTLLAVNGIVLQFCTLTGLWDWWAVLWTVEPLALGLSLLVIGPFKRSPALAAVGVGLTGFALFAMAGVAAVYMAGWWALRLAGPALLILAGGVLLLFGLVRRPVLQVPA